MTEEITTSETEETPKPSGDIINCPDCEKEHPRPKPGAYKCDQCFCKFIVEEDKSLKIVPFFDELDFTPILIMLGVLGLVLLVAMGDQYMPFMERLQFFLIFVAVVWGGFKLSQWSCRRYRGFDRFCRRISRPIFAKRADSLIDLNDEPDT